MTIYNKLVRDYIPQIIEDTGKHCSTKILTKEEYIKELKIKSFEEINEYMNAKNDKEAIDELADILEIIHTLAEYHANFEKVEQVRREKAEKRGGFKKRIFLIEVEDE